MSNVSPPIHTLPTMKAILNILKLLLGFCLALIGFFAANTYAARLGVTGPTKVLFLLLGLLPALVLLLLLNGSFRANAKSMLRPVSGKVWAWRGVGASVVLFGLFLLLGNRTGLFPSFPFAGTLVAVAGVLIVASKGK